jgi:hypothetical protein
MLAQQILSFCRNLIFICFGLRRFREGGRRARTPACTSHVFNFSTHLCRLPIPQQGDFRHVASSVSRLNEDKNMLYNPEKTYRAPLFLPRVGVVPSIDETLTGHQRSKVRRLSSVQRTSLRLLNEGFCRWVADQPVRVGRGYVGRGPLLIGYSTIPLPVHGIVLVRGSRTCFTVCLSVYT